MVVEPAGKSSWQDMLDYEAANPVKPKPPEVIPFMPKPGPRELPDLNSGTVGGENINVSPSDISSMGEITEYETNNPVGDDKKTVHPYMPGPELLKIENQYPADSEAGDLAGIFSAPGIIDNFLGLDDNNTSIPPDTMSAAGPNHLMVMLNTEVRIMDKTGTQIGSDVYLDNFWTIGTGLSGNPFDPKIDFDSLSDRWMATVDADVQSTTSAVWFAISDSDDPTGNWTFYAFDADAANTYWAGYPGFGMNSTWIAITNNMFTVAGNAFRGAKMWVIDKSTALAGGELTVTPFATGFDTPGNGFTSKPAMTFDASEPTLYIIDTGSYWICNGYFLHRVSRVTGTPPASPTWSIVPGSTYGSGFVAVTNPFDYSQLHGEDSYVKDFGYVRVRWGDYSTTGVDPVDDLTFWTLQEYAETDVGPIESNDR